VTRKTRLSALATAFGLTLTLGLALPIMATVTYTWHECTFTADAWLNSSDLPSGSVVETDPQCSTDNPNLGAKFRYVTKVLPTEWTYLPSWALPTGHNSMYTTIFVPSLAVNISAKAKTGVYPFTFSPYQPWID